MPTPLNWNDFQYFLAVCEKGSIVSAAKHLGVNHSTILRRLDSLEKTLGVRLFDRLPSGYALTSEGHELSGGLEGVTRQIDAAQRKLMGQDLAIEGVIRLTTSDTFISTLLMPLLAKFRKLHPKIEIQLILNNSFLNLTQREADVAVRGSNKPPDNLIGRPVGDIQTALYASRGYLKSLGRGHRTEDYQWVAMDDSLAHLDSMKWLRKNVPTDRIVFRVDGFVAMVAAVEAGIGVGMLLCPLAEERKELVRITDPMAQLDTRIWVLTHRDLKQVARISTLTNFLYEALRQDPRLVHR